MGDFSHIAIRQMYFFDNSIKKIRRAENRWENDIILGENRDLDSSSLHEIADRIGRIVQDLIHNIEVERTSKSG
jgi:hypothetical protein